MNLFLTDLRGSLSLSYLVFPWKLLTNVIFLIFSQWNQIAMTGNGNEKLLFSNSGFSSYPESLPEAGRGQVHREGFGDQQPLRLVGQRDVPAPEPVPEQVVLHLHLPAVHWPGKVSINATKSLMLLEIYSMVVSSWHFSIDNLIWLKKCYLSECGNTQIV